MHLQRVSVRLCRREADEGQHAAARQTLHVAQYLSVRLARQELAVHRALHERAEQTSPAQLTHSRQYLPHTTPHHLHVRTCTNRYCHDVTRIHTAEHHIMTSHSS